MNTPDRLTVEQAISVERQVARAFEDAGAVSPATARVLADIPGVTADAVMPLVSRQVVREGAPGRYYLYAGTEHARRRAWVIAVLALVILMLPALLLQVARR